jgi:hypothetical protein
MACRFRLALTPSEAHDNRLAGKLLPGLKAGSMQLADCGYDADWPSRKGAWANIQPKSKRNKPFCFSPDLYRSPQSNRTLLQQDQPAPTGRNTLRQVRRQLPRICSACVNQAVAWR